MMNSIHKYRINNVYLAAGLCTIGGLLQGFDVSSMSAIIGTQQYKEYFHNPGSVKQGGITASMAGGSLLGALFSSWTGDRFGRRDSLFIASIIWVIGSALMCSVQNIAHLIVARIVNGFAVGILTSQGPILIAELSTPQNRGRLISLQQWMITWGILIMYFLTFGTSYIKSPASFRIPWGVQMIPGLILFAAIPFIPRSPRWLASQDRWDEAIDILATLHAKGDKQSPLVLTEVSEIRRRIEIERQSKTLSWSELFKRQNIIRVTSAIFSHVWSQYSGTNAMFYYIVYIFQMAGLSGNFTLVAASVQYVIAVVMTVPALLWMDKWPRRKVMMYGSAGMAFWLFLEAGLMGRYGYAVPEGVNGVKTVTWFVSNEKASKAVIACSYLFIATYSVTWGPVGWVYPAEIIPLYIRSKAVSLATVFNWAMNFSLTFWSPIGFQTIQWKVHIIFGSLCCVALVHVFLLFQESCGKSLEEMDDVFKNESIWAFKVKYTKSEFGRAIERTAAQVNKEDGTGILEVEEAPART
ncbi:sugar transporter family protein [Mariannaea sp. PMI_226]|nr:sugar transporter family protein [Mariannaea sp. PMI_226]